MYRAIEPIWRAFGRDQVQQKKAAHRSLSWFKCKIQVLDY